MKKVISIVLSFVLALSMAACGAKEPAQTEAGSDSTSAPAADNQTEAQAEKETEAKQDSDSAELPDGYVTEDLRQTKSFKTVVYSRPADYGFREESVTDEIFLNDISLVTVSAINNEKIDKLIDIVDIFNISFGDDVGAVSKGYLSRSKIEVISHEPAMVNEWNAEKFIGKIPNVTSEKTWDCHVAGYVLEIENVQIMVVSLVSDMAQDPEVIANADALMEKIAKTIRIGE